MDKPTIEAYIIGGKQANGCVIGCGMDWFSAESLTLADKQIEARFGDSVRLQYLDLSETAAVLGQPLHRRIINENLPLLVINGEPRISGPFDIRMLLDAIEAEVEISI